ncbi:hypothetical protein BOTBODRAFT_607580 [Botryobasidium botryosum FD-172 SS1]|uniref:DUF6533 domain-containing protein n=1 Tax=Botryobasidium botryosum (strain FD-172 SS1) TaxID=930990 RepID=A0A067LWG3_BOTB1|nr:hypothetical protein BOTBODRAFT_607580 [Botryobasidium botryosum FD-172 SS1]
MNFHQVVGPRLFDRHRQPQLPIEHHGVLYGAQIHDGPTNVSLWYSPKSHCTLSRILTRPCVAAGFVTMVYDHGLSFSTEVELVWKAPWSSAKFLFLFVRYFTIISIVLTNWVLPYTDPLASCRVVVPLATALQIPCHAAADLLLLLRVYALWNRKRSAFVLLVGTYVVGYVSVPIFAGIGVAQMSDHRGGAAGHYLCYDHKSWAAVLVWPLSITFDVVAFTMTLIKGIEQSRTLQFRSRLLHVLCRDGLLYFVAIVLVKSLNVFTWSLAPLAYFSLGTYFDWATVSLLTTRMFLNLRSAMHDTDWLGNPLPRPGRKHSIDGNAIASSNSGSTLVRFHSDALAMGRPGSSGTGGSWDRNPKRESLLRGGVSDPGRAEKWAELSTWPSDFRKLDDNDRV